MPPTHRANSAASGSARLRSTVSISLAIDATIRLPISSRTRNASSHCGRSLGPDDAAVRVSPSSTCTVRRVPSARGPAAHDVVDVQHAAGFLGADASLVQREHRARAITNRLRSLARRVMTSWASARAIIVGTARRGRRSRMA